MPLRVNLDDIVEVLIFHISRVVLATEETTVTQGVRHRPMKESVMVTKEVRRSMGHTAGTFEMLQLPYIPIVGVGNRGAYYLVHGDLPRQHPRKSGGIP